MQKLYAYNPPDPLAHSPIIPLNLLNPTTYTRTRTHITGADWVPTIDLARLAASPPQTRKEVLRYAYAFHSFVHTSLSLLLALCCSVCTETAEALIIIIIIDAPHQPNHQNIHTKQLLRAAPQAPPQAGARDQGHFLHFLHLQRW